MGILTSPQLSAALLKFTPASLCLMFAVRRTLTAVCACAPNSSSEYSAFIKNLNWVLHVALVADSIVLLEHVNAHVGNNKVTGRDVIGRNGRTDLNLSGVLSLDFCTSEGLSITNTMFEHKVAYK